MCQHQLWTRHKRFNTFTSQHLDVVEHPSFSDDSFPWDLSVFSPIIQSVSKFRFQLWGATLYTNQVPQTAAGIFLELQSRICQHYYYMVRRHLKRFSYQHEESTFWAIHRICRSSASSLPTYSRLLLVWIRPSEFPRFW